MIGEAARHVPQSLGDRHLSVPWAQISGLRDILVHRYFSMNLPIIWDVVTNEAPLLHGSILAILREEEA
jgi:uncharacterized protein with HEPN domain